MPSTLYNGVLSYFQFDGSSEPFDNSLRGNNGVFTSAGTVVGGKFGKAMRTTDATGKLTVATDPILLAPRPRISVSLWVNLDKAFSAMWGGGHPMFVDKRNGQAKGYCLGVLNAGSNDLSFRIHNSAGTPYTATYTEAATSGWVHYVGVYAGTNVYLYRNGVQVASAVADGTLLENMIDPMDSIGLGFEGLIDEFILFNRALSGAEVTALYNGGAGQQIVYPTFYATAAGYPSAPYAPLSYTLTDDELVTPPTLPVQDTLVASAQFYSSAVVTLSAALAPYVLLDSPSRIYVDPVPVITNVTVSDNYVITAEGTGGPTDADIVESWWEIEILPGIVTIIADMVESIGFYSVRQARTDIWPIPLNQNWQGLKLTFVMQSTADASQVWRSPQVVLTGEGYNNNPGTKPLPPVPPLPPGPPLPPSTGPVIGPPGSGVFRMRTRDFSLRQG